MPGGDELLGEIELGEELLRFVVGNVGLPGRIRQMGQGRQDGVEVTGRLGVQDRGPRLVERGAGFCGEGLFPEPAPFLQAGDEGRAGPLHGGGRVRGHQLGGDLFDGGLRLVPAQHHLQVGHPDRPWLKARIDGGSAFQFRRGDDRLFKRAGLVIQRRGGERKGAREVEERRDELHAPRHSRLRTEARQAKSRQRQAAQAGWRVPT